MLGGSRAQEQGWGCALLWEEEKAPGKGRQDSLQGRGSPGWWHCHLCKAQRCPLGEAHPPAHPRLWELWGVSVRAALPILQVPHIQLALTDGVQRYEVLGSVGFVCVPALEPRQDTGTGPSWHSSSSGAGAAPAAGTTIKLMTGWQRAVGWEVGGEGR